MTVGKALEVWSVQALCDLGIFLSLLSAALHAADGYVARQFGSLALRMSTDLARALVLVVRDGALLLAVLIGLFHLNLDLMADIKIGLPFVPMATVVLLAALLVKLAGDAAAPGRARRIAGGLVVLGATLNFAGFVLVMEAPGAEYGFAGDSAWAALRALRSNLNPRLSVACFGVALPLVVLAPVVAALAARRGRSARSAARPSGGTDALGRLD